MGVEEGKFRSSFLLSLSKSKVLRIDERFWLSFGALLSLTLVSSLLTLSLTVSLTLLLTLDGWLLLTKLRAFKPVAWVELVNPAIEEGLLLRYQGLKN